MKPFLKWAGNKYRIIDAVREVLPTTECHTLVEPFAGSCAVSLNTDYAKYTLSDANSDLINLYRVVLSEQFEQFLVDAKALFPKEIDAESYYEDRKRFNKEPRDTMLRGALFLRMNKYCFNGLTRYSAQGKYNVPFGKRGDSYFPEEEMRAFRNKFAGKASFIHGDFKRVMVAAEPGSIIYADPPYLPRTKTASFVGYSKEGFTEKDHLDLAALAELKSLRGVPVVISNRNTTQAHELYKSATRIVEIEVMYAVGGKGRSKSKEKEILAVYQP